MNPEYHANGHSSTSSSSSSRRDVSRAVAFPNSSRRASAAAACNQHSISPTNGRTGKNSGSGISSRSEYQSHSGSYSGGEGREEELDHKESKQTSRNKKSSHQRSRRRPETSGRKHQPLPSSAFVPENPSCNMIQRMFMDVKTADVVFEVDEKRGTRSERVNFYAHRCILQQCVPQLAELCGSGGDGTSSVSIKDVKPHTFYYLLSYLYGVTVPEKELVANAKGLIEAADRYGISSLKLEAEACFVESRKISYENMMKYLLYAEATNCALLKEAVMDFIVENKVEVLENVALKDAPGGLLADVLAAMARGEKKGTSGIAKEPIQLSTLRISDLRRRSHEKGLDVNKSRENLIAALKESSSEISSLECYKR